MVRPAMLFDRTEFFARLRERTGALTQQQVDGARTLLALIETDPEVTDLRVAAYLLATAYHETARTLQPIAERGTRDYFDALYDPKKGSTDARRARARSMGNVTEGDGYRYRGRGYVQVTWGKNYAKLGTATGVDLISDPDRAMEPAIAYVALSRGMREGWWTGRRLDEYIRPAETDYVDARRVVNGVDRAQDIARYAHLFGFALGCSAFSAASGGAA